MTKHAVIFMAPGFEEMELTITVDILRRAEVEVLIATLNEDLSPVTGSRGIRMIPDILLKEVNLENTDLIILPGGIDGTKNLGASDEVIRIVNEMHKAGKIIAAICAAPAVLVKAGICKGKNLTSHPGAKAHMVGVNYSQERVVKDGNIITSRAAGTTFEFAFFLMNELLGEEPGKKVNMGVLAKI